MKNKSVSIPIGMLKKFYCHKCGERLRKHSRTRTLRRGDPDYEKHSVIGGTHVIGDVELTEYDGFQCPACGSIVEYGEQCIVEKIQKQLGKNILSENEIADRRDSVKEKIDRNGKISRVIFTAVICGIAALLLCMKIQSGDFSFDFYF